MKATHGRAMRSRAAVLVLGASLVAAAASLTGALAAPKPATTAQPTITSGPSGLVSNATASFSFTGPSGATFRCSLDGATYAVCTSPTPSAGVSEGAHTFRVTAQVSGKAVSSPATRSWTVDSIAPLAPVITDGPDDPTNNHSVGFDYAVAESGASVECKLDDASFSSCSNNHAQYTAVEFGEHCFVVRAYDAAGNRSAASDAWCWTTVIDEFPISGSATGALFPGNQPVPMSLSIGNPYNFDLIITSVTVDVADPTMKDDAANDNCIGSENVEVVRHLDASTSPIVIPPRSTRTLTELDVAVSRWPAVRMINLADVNQDACKGTRFTFEFSGTATK